MRPFGGSTPGTQASRCPTTEPEASSAWPRSWMLAAGNALELLERYPAIRDEPGSGDHSSVKYCGHTGCVVLTDADGVTALVLQAVLSNRTAMRTLHGFITTILPGCRQFS